MKIMTRARKESTFHIALLVLVQWISLAVVILNATVLFLLNRGDKQLVGLVNQYSSPADYILLILGSFSFLASSILLLLHLHIHFRIMDDCPFTPSRTLSATEVILSVISIALWTVATSVLLTHSQELTSPCRFTYSLYSRNPSDICELFDTTLMLAFAGVGSWVLVLLATLFILIRSPIPPTTIFTIEAPPQRFSQPMMVSLPDEVYSCSTAAITRPYYLGHANNKVGPTMMNNNVLSITHSKQNSNTSSIQSSNNNRQTIMMLHDYYQPQHNMVLSSPSLIATTIEEELSRLSPQAESQISLSTMNSSIFNIRTGFQTIQLDLPIIQVGRISQMDASFLEKISSKRQ